MGWKRDFLACHCDRANALYSSEFYCTPIKSERNCTSIPATMDTVDDKRTASVVSAPNYNLASENDAADLGTRDLTTVTANG